MLFNILSSRVAIFLYSLCTVALCRCYSTADKMLAYWNSIGSNWLVTLANRMSLQRPIYCSYFEGCAFCISYMVPSKIPSMVLVYKKQPLHIFKLVQHFDQWANLFFFGDQILNESLPVTLRLLLRLWTDYSKLLRLF